MRILVTGGTGFIGSALINRLLTLDGEPHEITSLDDYSTGSISNHVDNSRVRYINLHTSQIRRLDSSDVIFHLGEYSRLSTSFDDSLQLWRSNALGTACVLDEWRRTKARLIYAASSSQMAGANLSPYTFTKHTNCQLIRNYAEWYGLQYALTYFYNVYGPGQISTGKMATVIGIFEREYERGAKLPIVKPGTQRRDFTHVSDVVDGLCCVMMHAAPPHEYHLCSGASYSMFEVAEMFGSEYYMQDERLGERFHCDYADDMPSLITATRNSLNWQPHHTLPDYLRNFRQAHDAKLSETLLTNSHD